MINKYPKSIKLFKQWFKNNQNVCEYDYELFSKEDDLESLENSIFLFDSKFFVNYVFFNRGSLIEFFDEQGILIDSVALRLNEFYCIISINGISDFTYTNVYSTRFESLTEAFEIAFNMLEIKL